MFKTEKSDGELIFLLKALFYWLITAIILVTISSIIIGRFSIDSSYIAYVSSLISFGAALAAGIAAAKNRGGSIYTGLITGIFLVIILLTAGFLIDGENLGPDGIISVVSFSLAGTLCGCVLKSLGLKRINKRSKKGHRSYHR